MYKILFVVLFACSVNCQIQLPGVCNFTKFDTVQFELLVVTDTWYQVERIANSQETGQCSTTTFSVNNNTRTATISTREVHEGHAHYRNGTIIGANQYTATINFTDATYTYAALKTDYKSYALLYSCRDGANNTKMVWAWKLAKAKTLSAEYKNIIDNAVKASEDLQNATWISISHDEKSCKVNSADPVTRVSSLILLISLAIMVKNFKF